MKRITILLFVIWLTSLSTASAQYLTGKDDAGNYSTWANNENQGYGFSAWDLWTSGNAGFFIGNSLLQGFGDINVDDKAFGMYGNPDGDNFSNAQRLFTIWSDGATFSIDMAIAYRNGNKGIDIFATGFELIWNFNVGGDNYTAGGVNQGWAYSQTSVFQLTVTQNGSDVDITLIRGADIYTTTIPGKSLIGFKLYCGSTDDNNDLNNLYFNNLKIAYADPEKVPATADVQVNGTVILPWNKTLTVNDFSIPTGNSFTIESTSSGTGSLIINGSCTDEISVERYLTGGWAWHFLSSPVIDQAIVGANNFIEFPGGQGDQAVDCYRFGETETSGQPWINIKSADGTLNQNFGNPSGDPYFEEKLGYLVAYQGADRTMVFSGVPYNLLEIIWLSYTVGGGEGWNLLGNPFTSAVDWDEILTYNGFLEDLYTTTYYIYNQEMNGGGGGYEWYTDNVNKSANTNGKIPAMQAFFVRAKNIVLPSMIIPPQARTHDDQEYFKTTVENQDRLHLKIEGDTYFSDGWVTIHDNGTIGIDNNDAFMLFSLNNEVPHVYSLAEGEKMVSNHVQFPDEDYSIPLGIRAGSAGNYTITAVDIENFNSSILPVLEDTETGAEIDLRFEGSYTFVVNEPGTNNSRFILHLKSAVGIAESTSHHKPQIHLQNNNLRVSDLPAGKGTIRVMDINGRIISTESYQNVEEFSLSLHLKMGIYFVEVANENGKYTSKIYIK